MKPSTASDLTRAVLIMLPLRLSLLTKQCCVLKNLKSLHVSLLCDLSVAQLIASLFLMIYLSPLRAKKKKKYKLTKWGHKKS